MELIKIVLTIIIFAILFAVLMVGIPKNIAAYIISGGWLIAFVLIFVASIIGFIVKVSGNDHE